LIDSYRFGRIVVDGVEYNRDIIILPDGVEADWWRLEGHQLAEQDLKKVLEAKPEVLVVGMGAEGRMKVLESTKQRLSEEGITLIAQKTSEAIKTYNELLRAEKLVAAALHITC